MDMVFVLLFTSLAHCVLETAVKDAEEVGGFIFACLANLALECADFSEAIFSNVSLVL